MGYVIGANVMKVVEVGEKEGKGRGLRLGISEGEDDLKLGISSNFHSIIFLWTTVIHFILTYIFINEIIT